MGYYHIELSLGKKDVYTNILPWRKYKYQKLHMGVCNNPNIFQENISKLFEGFSIVSVYIDNILVITKDDSKDHLNALEKVLPILVNQD